MNGRENGLDFEDVPSFAESSKKKKKSRSEKPYTGLFSDDDDKSPPKSRQKPRRRSSTFDEVEDEPSVLDVLRNTRSFLDSAKSSRSDKPRCVVDLP